MKLNYKTSKRIGMIIGVVLFIALIGGITYAIFNWRSTDTNISIDTTCFDIAGDSSITVQGSNMLLFDENDILNTTNHTITYKNGMTYAPFKITMGNCNIDTYYEIKVNVTTLSNDYKNGSIKYKVIEDLSSNQNYANPLNENLAYTELFSGTITDTGTFKAYVNSITSSTTVVPAIIFYIDGDLVPENAANLTFNASVEVVANQGEYVLASTYITNLYTNATKSPATVNGITYSLASSVGLMRDQFGSSTSASDTGNLRYYGADPNNYVWLGDTYTSTYTFTSKGSSITRNAGDKKLWRIIGVFDGRLKLISNDPISGNTGLSWDTSANTTGGNSAAGINQWGPSGSYEGADLMRLLNPEHESESVNNSLYWNKTSSGTVYTSYNNTTTPNVSFANTGLTANERSLIDTATWYTGAYDQESYADAHYTAERENMGKICTQGNTGCDDTVTRTNTWNGKVGLISVSDYGYAANLAQCNQTLDRYLRCTSSNWLSIGRFEWTISSRALSGNARGVFYVRSDGALYDDDAYYAYAVRPAVFLKSGVTISSGNGSESNPFVLG